MSMWQRSTKIQKNTKSHTEVALQSSTMDKCLHCIKNEFFVKTCFTNYKNDSCSIKTCKAPTISLLKKVGVGFSWAIKKIMSIESNNFFTQILFTL